MMRRRGRAAAAVLLAACIGAAHAQSARMVEDGKRIYEQGILPSGDALRGHRAGMEVSGREAACAACHRESGMGAYEGTRVVPPIAGRVLYEPVVHEEKQRRGRSPEFSERYVRARPAYTAESLAHVLRTGVNPHGESLAWLMPRYELDGESFAALDAYLKTLSSAAAAGIDAEAVHFATIITPDVPAERASLMLDVLDACLQERTAGQQQDGSERAWKLHVWRLEGAPESWPRQLERAQAHRPVFAIVSGISGGGWGAIDAFCERNGVPCLFPNTDLPQSRGGLWSMYLSGGIQLEAAVLARQFRDEKGTPAHVVQVYREGEIGQAAAEALDAALAGSAITVERRVVAKGSPMRRLQVRAGDALVLWLDARDLAALPGPVPPVRAVYVSGSLGGFEKAPLPAQWRDIAFVVYPNDLPEPRHARQAYSLQPWLERHGIALKDERLQGSTLAACNLMAEGMARIRDIYQPRYLLESIEIAQGNAAASTPFPRFSLAAGQRFGSKGAYLVRLGADGAVEPRTGWIVP